jgi:hypothetical protein
MHVICKFSIYKGIIPIYNALITDIFLGLKPRETVILYIKSHLIEGYNSISLRIKIYVFITTIQPRR